ncbi:MAG: leucine--tRNA ligase [Dehalococcoidia bacterium]|nr:leucine--tRNA ligase [Dehalococcoidia bacterium]MSQ34679.1 leucine--tRNA ligase [Dehalococcoidia bacterium]
MPADIELKWQRRWEESGIYRAKDHVEGKKNWFALTMFPYPSGDVHIGHWYAYAPGDAHARFMRMAGYNVMHPQGFDAFGLPAENAAIQRGTHPRQWTLANVENMRRQFRLMGNSYDWDREIVTCTPEYYRWNQYFFLKFMEAGLAYRKAGPANWCPSCNTTLANEQVKDGKCERCETAVTKRDLPQWFFRITKYADELLQMDEIEWPEKIKLMQRNWIGKSEGVTVHFDVSAFIPFAPSYVATFTTRIDTVFGVTFVVLAPEHPLVEKLTQPAQRKAVHEYIENARRQSEIERTSTEREKTGVATGAYAVNPLNGERVPVLVGDYVLATYGTGAVMGVPAHDERDFAFAKKYGLPIRVVVAPPGWSGGELDAAYVEPGTQVNSGEFNGLPSKDGMQRMAEKVEREGWGSRTTTYHLRDWLISRQRYWGTPIPVIYCDPCGTVPVPVVDLPVLLPEKAEFRPTGQSPLTLDPTFVNVKCPKCGRAAKRETDTMDTFMDSSWYHLRFTSAHDRERPFSLDSAGAWAPVHQYMGGAEHAVMHLLYSRFFSKALRDLGYVKFDEPYKRLFNQGLLIKDHKKISKRSNPLNPEPVVEQYGADTLRLYLMFLGPWDQGGDWSDAGIRGVSRWLIRVWDLVQSGYPSPQPTPKGPASMEGGDKGGVSGADRDTTRASHMTTKRVVTDMREFRFNTAISALMEFTNKLSETQAAGGVSKPVWDDAMDRLVLLLAPLAPHTAEELWERRSHAYSVHQQALPVWDESLVAADTVTIVIQVNGKLRSQVVLPAGVSEAEAIASALADAVVQRHMEGREIVRKIYVPNRLVNVVVK